MKISAGWKMLIASAAIAGLGLVGAGTAAAEATSSGDRASGGASLIRTETNGSTQIRTAPQQRAPQPGYASGQFGSPYEWHYGSYYYGSND